MRALVVPLAALALAGCAKSSSIVLLPDEDGGHGAVAIHQGAGSAETLVDQPNSRATLGARPTVRPLGDKGLRPEEAALLAALPPAARSFTLYFRQGTTDLTPDSLPMLEALRAEIAARPGAEIQVTGHTDSVGSSDDNDRLSRRRAEEIVGLLATRGFDRSIMSAVGRGERELREMTADNVANPVNRRVEVLVR